MINWISSEDEKDVKKVDVENLKKAINYLKSLNSDDEMTKYVCELFDEYKDILVDKPNLLRSNLEMKYGDNFVVDDDIEKSDIIISPSDLNSYYTIKQLNKDKKDLAIVCFDFHSDTYDYNDFLWKGNSFSKLMKEGYINHYIVIGVPEYKRQMVLDDTNEDLKQRVHLINEEELYKVILDTNCKNVFISIDADCFDCRKSKYTAVEYSPSTILNYISRLNLSDINETNYKEKVLNCVHVKNELGYSNYYKTGENDLSVEKVIQIMNNVLAFCEINDIQVGFEKDGPFFQIMEVSGYDYGDLTAKMVAKLIKSFSLKEVRKDGKSRILRKDSKNV